MNQRWIFLGMFLACAFTLMASPAMSPWPRDWVDRAVADHASWLQPADGGAVSVRMFSPDEWLAATGTPARQPGDWVDRMVADRSTGTGAASQADATQVTAAVR